MLNETSIALAAPIIVSFRAPSPDYGPAPAPYEPPSSDITLSPAEYHTIIDSRGW
jgi:hypothetical protein